MFSGLKQKIGQGLADTANRSLNLVNQVKQDGNARTPSSARRTSSSTPISTPTGVLVDVGSPTSDLQATNSDAVTSSSAKTDGKSGSAVASRSRTSSISSQASDASFLTPQSSSVVGQLSFQSADDRASVSEAETDDQSAVLASMTKEELYQMFAKVQRRGQQYKWKYMQLVTGYKELEEERKKLETTLTQTQDKNARRISELREQSQLDKQAKADLENNYQLMLDEKDEVIQVLRTQVNLLKEGKDLPAELQSKLEKSKSLLEPPASLNDPSSASFGPDEAALREKVKRLEALLTKCKETIKSNKDRTQQLVTDKESIQKQLEMLQKEFETKNNEFDSFRAQHDEAVAKYQGQLKQARQVIEELEADKTMAVAAAKQELHAALENKDEEVIKIRDKLKALEAENETLKHNIEDLKQAGKERQEKSEEIVRRLTEENRRLEEESRLKLENSEKNLEQVRANELQELRRGKVEALQVLQKQMDERIQALLAEKEAALAERDKHWEDKWKQREAVKEADLQTRLANRLAEMELAVEDQQLQKTAAVKQQEFAIRNLEQKCVELTEQNRDLVAKLNNAEQQLSDRTKEYIEQVEENAARHKDQLSQLTEKHQAEMTSAIDECTARQERLVDEVRAEYDIRIAELGRVHGDQLRRTASELELTYGGVIDELKSSHTVAIEEYKLQIAQLQKEITDFRYQASTAAGEVAQTESTWRERERDLNDQIANMRETCARLEGQVREFAERENQLNVELEATKVDRERRIAAQNEAMQQLRSEIATLTASESVLRNQLDETTRRCDERVERLSVESSEAINGLSTMLQNNQMELMSIMSELDSAQRQLAETVVRLDERSTELDCCRAELSKMRDDLAQAVESEDQMRLNVAQSESQCSLLREKIASYEQQIINGGDGTGELMQRIADLEARLIAKDRAITEFEHRVRDFGDQIGRETASVHQRSKQVESLLVDNGRLLREKESLAREQFEKIGDLQAKIEQLEAALVQSRSESGDQLDACADKEAAAKEGDSAREKFKLEHEIKVLKEQLEQSNQEITCFKESVRKQFDERKQKIKLTVERMKAGFEETLRERDEQHERAIRSLEEQKNREKSEAVKELTERIQSLTTDRDTAIAEALAQQTAEVDYLKAQLASTKVRLRDLMSQNQAEKDALLRHAVVEKTGSNHALDEVKQENSMDTNVAIGSPVKRSDSVGFAGSERLESVAIQQTESTSLTVSDDVIRRLEDEVAELKKQLELKSIGLEESYEKLKAAESKVEESQRQYDVRILELTSSVSSQEAELGNKQQRIDQLEEELKQLRSAADASEAEKKNEITRYQSELAALQGDKESALDQLKAKCCSLEEKEDELRKITESVRLLEEEVKQWKSSVDSLTDEKDRAVGTLEQAKQQLASKTADLEAKEIELVNLSSHVSSLEEQNKDHEVKINSKDLEIEKYRQEIEDVKNQYVEKMRNLETSGDSKLEQERSMFRALLDERTLQVEDLESKIRDREREFEITKEQLNGEIFQLREKIVNVELEQKTFKEQADSESSELASRKAQISELEDELCNVKKLLDAKKLEAESSSCELKRLQDEISTLRNAADERHADLERSHAAKIEELQRTHEELDNKSKELVELSSEILRLQSALEEVRHSAAAEQSKLSADLIQKDSAVDSLAKQHELEIAALSAKFNEELAQFKTERDSLLQQQAARLSDLEGINGDLIVQLERLKDSKTQTNEDRAEVETVVEDLKLQLGKRDEDLADMKHRLAVQVETRDQEFETLRNSLIKFGRGLKTLQCTAEQLRERMGPPSDEPNILLSDVDGELEDHLSTMLDVKFDYQEIASVMSQLAAENSQSLAKINDLEKDVQRLLAGSIAVTSPGSTTSERRAGTLTKLTSDPFGQPVADSVEVDEFVSAREAGGLGLSRDESTSSAARTDTTEQMVDSNMQSIEHYKAHIEQLNAIIEDLQQRLLDQEMEIESSKSSASQSLASSAAAPQEVSFVSDNEGLAAMSADQLRVRVAELTRQLEESNWLHTMEVNEIRSRQGAINGAASPVSPAGHHGNDDVNRLLAEVSRLRNRERELLREVDVARSSGHTAASTSSVDNVYAVFGPLLTEPTEIEYLRNILYQYMLGTETKTLAKVICKVMKFSDEQTRHVIEKEGKREPWLSPTHH